MTEPSTATSDKPTLRREALARRDAIDAKTRAGASAKICAVAGQAIEGRGSRIIAGYWPIRSEVDCRPLLESLHARNITVVLPVVTGEETLRFRLWRKGEALVPAGFGTLGPAGDAPETVPDVIVMPLAGFDADGHRLGYGKGHYDRAVARLNGEGMQPYLLGLAFAVQEVSPIPFEDHDMRLDAIVTEAGIRSMSGNG